MNKDEILKYLNSSKKDIAKIIVWYCLEKGKDTNATNNFIQALLVNSIYDPNNLLKYCYDYALNYYTTKYNITLIYDKNNNFVKAF